MDGRMAIGEESVSFVPEIGWSKLNRQGYARIVKGTGLVAAGIG
jgi:hypothetical protein